MTRGRHDDVDVGGIAGARLRRFFTLIGLAAVVVAASASTQAAAQPAAPHEVIVRFTPDASAADRAGARTEAEGELAARLPLPDTQVLALDPGATVGAAVRALERDPSVAYAEPNQPRHAAAAATGDPLSGYQWSLANSGQDVRGTTGVPGADVAAPAAWALTTGRPEVTVAVLDTGVGLEHPDLAAGLWQNAGEIPGNGRDDDDSGFADDRVGWDFVDSDARPDDAAGHGTHVAGVIAARSGNGIGISGLAPGTSVMALRVLDGRGDGTTAELVAAIGYAARAGVRVVNASVGSSGFSRVERDAIAAAPNTLFVTTAGNGGADAVGDDLDAAPEYPCAHDLANIVCVAASDRSDGLAGFSNYGARSVDLAAPGVDVLSTVPGGQGGSGDYGFRHGTSMAAPHVAAAAALILARSPTATATDVKRALLAGADVRPGLAGRTVSGGRLNVRRALTGEAATAPRAAPAPARARRQAAPLVSVEVARRARVGRVLTRGLRLRVRCSRPCRSTASLSVPAPAPARSAHAATTPLTHSAPAGPSARAQTLVLRPAPAVRRRLLAVRDGLLTRLTVRALDDSGNARTVRLRVRLRR